MIRLIVMWSCVLVAAWPVPAQTRDERHGVREFTASGTWIVPPGVTHITIELWGAGGGGAGGGSAVGGNATGGGGAGGGSGPYVRASVAVHPGDVYTIRLGAGGSPGRGESREAAQPGGDGEETTVLQNGKALLVAAGGRGGGAPKSGDIRGGEAGAGGVAEPAPSRLVRPGNSGDRGRDGGFADWSATAGGAGGPAVLGSLLPPGSFGRAGGDGRQFGSSDGGEPGGAGSAVITW